MWFCFSNEQDLCSRFSLHSSNSIEQFHQGLVYTKWCHMLWVVVFYWGYIGGICFLSLMIIMFFVVYSVAPLLFECEPLNKVIQKKKKWLPQVPEELVYEGKENAC